jgi:S-DNA-T family DNA segregation ATPase FtsK/SpoIIIE
MRITKGVLFLILAAFLGVALASYHEEDWGSFWRVRNLCGPIGAAIAGVIRLLFGPVLSWFWPLFILWVAILVFRDTAVRGSIRRIICAISLVVIVSAIAAIFGGVAASGVVGLKTLGLLRLVAGRVGSGFILAACFVVVSFLLFPGAVESLLGRVKRSLVPGRLPERSKGGASGGAKRRGKKEGIREIPVIVESEPDAGRDERRGRTVEGRGEEASPKIRVPQLAAERSQEVVLGESEEPSFLPRTTPSDAPLPDLSILDDYEAKGVSYSKDDLIARSEIIEKKLKDYGLDGKIQEVRPGPVVTTFEFVPAAGVKVSQIASRADDISLALAARSIRIQAPIPGRGAVGIEVPNPEPSLVSLKELLEQYPVAKEGLTVALGKTVTGEAFFADLADMPHLLIAGATGSGKSVCINTIICSLLFHHSPATCKFILVDPKRLELITYNDIPPAPPGDHRGEGRPQGAPVAHRRNGSPVQAARLGRGEEHPELQSQGSRGGGDRPRDR